MRSARRVPRKIGSDDDDGDKNPQSDGSNISVTAAVKRPVAKPRIPLSKPNKSSTLRTSFNVDDELPSDSVPKRKIGPQVVERSRDLPVRATNSLENRPSYNTDYLNELKTSTLSTPRASDTELSDSAEQDALDISAKFGDSALALSHQDPVSAYHIPTEAEIREKKERRRRLAQEQDYISLNDGDDAENDDSDNDSENDDPRKRSLIIPAEDIEQTSKYGETRLVHEDEDIAEGFDEFIEDSGKVALGRKAAKQQERDRRKEIEEQIRSAQHGYSKDTADDGGMEQESEDEEETARNAAYEAAQTRAGTYATSTTRKKDNDKEERLRRKLEMPKVKPVPDFKSVLARFTEMVTAKEQEIKLTRKRLDMLEKERVEIEEDEARVKTLLQEAGDRYQALRAESTVQPATETNGHGENAGNQEAISTLDATMDDASSNQDKSSPEREAERGSLNLDSLGQQAHQAPAGMAQIARDEDEYY